jgi:hypothetical protein
MEQLDAIIAEATTAIPEPYFLLPVNGGDARYRERVYCYELYHQMRRIWPEDANPYWLGGEIDKAGHPVMTELAGAVKPDFLVHVPGAMDNFAIIEVKPQRASTRGIKKDLTTLANFVTHGQYHRAIYLIYGYQAEVTAARLQHILAATSDLPPIEIWVHRNPGTPAERIS